MIITRDKSTFDEFVPNVIHNERWDEYFFIGHDDELTCDKWTHDEQT